MTISRVHGFDALRSFCMLFGILVHTATVADFGLAESLPYVSSLFRMATFFAVSAFLSGVVLSRQPAGTYLRRRLLSLGVPLAFGLVVLNPPTLWLVAKVHNSQLQFGFGEVLAQSLRGEGRLNGPIHWHLHLWFLFPLIAFSILAAPMLGAIRRLAGNGGLAWLAETPAALRLPALAVLTAALGIVGRAVAGAVLPPLPNLWPLRAALLHLPFFMLGLVLFCLPSLWMRQAGNVRAMPGLALIVLLDPVGQGLLGDDLTPHAIAVLRSLSMAASALLLLVLSTWLVRRRIHAVEVLTDGIYTLYLSHFLFVYLLAWVLVPLDPPRPLLFWTIVAAATAAGLGLHVVVRRVPVLRFLLNGVAPPRGADVEVQAERAAPEAPRTSRAQAPRPPDAPADRPVSGRAA